MVSEGPIQLKPFCGMISKPSLLVPCRVLSELGAIITTTFQPKKVAVLASRKWVLSLFRASSSGLGIKYVI